MKYLLLITLCFANVCLADKSLFNANFKLITSTRYGGAVSSIVYNGLELIDKADNGRLLQSAVSYDNLGEACNPTQGGDITATKTSKVFLEKKVDNKIINITEMAYWWPTGKGLNCTPQKNKLLTETSILSPHTILTNITYTVPDNYTHATFEALTGYMNPLLKYSMFFNPDTQTETDTGSFIGEQSLPVIHYDFIKARAVGVFSPQLPQNWFGANVGYGRFTFPFTHVTKFNCVFREDNLKKDEVRTYQCMTVMGTLDEVKAEITRLHFLYIKH